MVEALDRRVETVTTQRALITGAGGGLGCAVARALARDGIDVVLTGRTAATLDRTADMIRRESHSGVSTHTCDLLDDNDIDSLLDSVGDVDILINNAGANEPQPFTDVSHETLDRLWALNVRAPFKIAQHVASGLLRLKRPGIIINITSQMGHVGAANRSVYCTTKHALEGLTKAVAVELAPHSIRVVSVAPTFVRTPMTEPFLDDPDFAQATIASIPTGRLAEPDEIAEAVAFLCRPSAAMITGTSLRIDGGWTAQ